MAAQVAAPAELAAAPVVVLAEAQVAAAAAATSFVTCGAASLSGRGFCISEHPHSGVSVECELRQNMPRAVSAYTHLSRQARLLLAEDQ